MIIPRDRSWVSFNERVLQEAADPTNPLYERIKFLAIFSSNLDEFYRVRIAKLRQYKSLRKSLRPKMEEKPSRLIREINEVVVLQQKWYGEIYRNDILPSLRKEGIFLKSSEEYSEKEARKLDSFFEEVLKPEIELYYLDREIPFLEDKALYLFGYDGNRAVLISIPEQSDRFVELISEPDFLSFSYIDDILRYKTETLLENPSERFFSIKLSRDTELYLDEDDLSQELVQQIADKIASRNAGLATRLLYDTNMPSSDLVYLKSKLHINEVDLMPGGRYHNMNDLFSLPKPEGKPHLFNKPLPPLPHPELSACDDLLDFVRENEVLLSVPYQSFDYVIELIHEAANDPKVHSISITLYRLSQDSKVAKALLDAVLKGKKVVAFIEAKARFDEKNNIYWGTKLKEAGATVLYSMPYIKVHSKIMLIESDEGSVSYVGTGNFSEKNAKLYTDFFYITHRKDVASDLNQVFTYLCGQRSIPEVKSIWLSPWSTRDRILECIDREMKAHENGRVSGVFLKMNGLEDPEVIEKLCEASDLGVPVRLLVRGICCLAPGESGPGKDIQIRSIVDRFLEHPRLYWFHNGGKESVYLASADCMVRNLDKRIEIGVEVRNQKLKEIIQDYMEIQWADNVKARIIEADMKNEFYRNDNVKTRSQIEIYEYFNQNVESDVETKPIY